jgi:putative acetyltransferase
MLVREASESEYLDALAIEAEAFASHVEANLVKELLADPSARPFLSLLAFQDNQAVGHILFTKLRLEPDVSLSASLLAPLAVLPGHQGQGIGGQLIEQGFQVLSDSGIDLVFVLGYPNYYSRFGFESAGKLGFDAPYPIPEEVADAWMVKALKPNVLRPLKARVVCADALMKPEYWRE